MNTNTLVDKKYILDFSKKHSSSHQTSFRGARGGWLTEDQQAIKNVSDVPKYRCTNFVRDLVMSSESSRYLLFILDIQDQLRKNFRHLVIKVQILQRFYL